jgi:glycerophosphoryl diester phosphodiesterase
VPDRPLISAHRGGREAGAPGSYEAYQAALAAGADYLEFDVRGTSDGTLVAYHGARVRHGPPTGRLSYAELCELAGYRVPVTADLLRLISAGRARAHIDLKDSACAGQITEQALAMLDPAAMVITTRDLAAAGQLRRRYPGVPVGIAVGGDLAETTRYLRERIRAHGLSRLAGATATGASWVVLHWRLARPGILADCRRRELAVMVWTVNSGPQLRRMLGLRDVSVVVTDRPARAVRLRASYADGCSSSQ